MAVCIFELDSSEENTSQNPLLGGTQHVTGILCSRRRGVIFLKFNDPYELVMKFLMCVIEDGDLLKLLRRKSNMYHAYFPSVLPA
jgi:hypothetical protein